MPTRTKRKYEISILHHKVNIDAIQMKKEEEKLVKTYKNVKKGVVVVIL